MTHLHFHTKFHSSKVSGSLDTDIKPIRKSNFPMAAMLLFYKIISPQERFHTFERPSNTHDFRTLKHVAPPPLKFASAASGY